MKRLFEEHGLRKCMRKGCRGPEVAAFAVEMWLDKIHNCSSDHLTTLVCNLPRGNRGVLIAELQSIRESLCEIYSAKFEMWQHLPYMLIGLACDDIALAKACAKRAKSEWDSCDQGKAHRVAHVFLSDPILASQLDMF